MAKKKEKKPAKAPKGDESEAPPKKPGGGFTSKTLMLFVLGTASFGTVFMLPGNTSQTSITSQEKHGDDHAETKTIDLTVDTAFLSLTPLTISLQDNSRVLKIGITLETTAGEEDYIDPNDPKIRDAFMGYLRALRIEQIEDAAFMAQMRSQLLRRAKLILGPDIVHGILITDFLVR